MLTLTPTNGQGPIRVVNVVGGLPSGNAVSPLVATPYTVLSVPAVWRAVNFLADNLASFPRDVHRGGRRRTDEAPPHPVERLLKRRPNGYQNAFTLWRCWFAHVARSGNGYLRIGRAADAGRPASLHNMLPEDVTPFRYWPDGSAEPEQWYWWQPAKTVLPSSAVVHLQMMSHDGMAGTDPVAMHAPTFERAGTLDRYLSRYLIKGTVLKGSVEIPGELTPAQHAEYKEVLRRYRGPESEDDYLILSMGGKLNNATTSPQDAQLLQQAAYSAKQVAQIYGIPPHFLFEFADAKYKNDAEAMGQDLVRFCFRPWLEQIEDELTTKLLSDVDQDAGYAVKLDPSALLRGDTQQQAATVAGKVKAGLISRNEGRAELGYERDGDPDSDKLMALGDTAPPPRSPAEPAAA